MKKEHKVMSALMYKNRMPKEIRIKLMMSPRERVVFDAEVKLPRKGRKNEQDS